MHKIAFKTWGVLRALQFDCTIQCTFSILLLIIQFIIDSNCADTNEDEENKHRGKIYFCAMLSSVCVCVCVCSAPGGLYDVV